MAHVFLIPKRRGVVFPAAVQGDAGLPRAPVDGMMHCMSVEIVIERTENEAEARVCAAMMAESEPWITLRRDLAATLKLTGGRTKEVYVARAGKEIAGHIVVNMEGAFVGYIQARVVGPAWRGQKIGERLMRFAEERIFRESPNVFLTVAGFNPRAQKFYARLGYERIGELKDYVIAGESEILLRKSVGPKDEFRPRR